MNSKITCFSLVCLSLAVVRIYGKEELVEESQDSTKDRGLFLIRVCIDYHMKVIEKFQEMKNEFQPRIDKCMEKPEEDVEACLSPIKRDVVAIVDGPPEDCKNTVKILYKLEPYEK